MDTGGEGREAKTESSSTTDAKAGTGAPTPRPTSRMGLVLGSLAGLLILAGAIYYFADQRAGTEVATETRSERPADNPTIAQTPRPPDSSQQAGVVNDAAARAKSSAGPIASAKRTAAVRQRSSASADAPCRSARDSASNIYGSADNGGGSACGPRGPACSDRAGFVDQPSTFRARTAAGLRPSPTEHASRRSDRGSFDGAALNARPTSGAARSGGGNTEERERSGRDAGASEHSVRAGQERSRDRDGAQRRDGKGARPLRKLGPGRNRRRHRLDQCGVAGLA